MRELVEEGMAKLKEQRMNAYASADPLGRSMVGVMDRTITSVATSPSSSFKQKRPSSGSKPSAASPLEKRPSKPTSPSTASKPPETLKKLSKDEIKEAARTGDIDTLRRNLNPKNLDKVLAWLANSLARGAF